MDDSLYVITGLVLLLVRLTTAWYFNSGKSISMKVNYSNKYDVCTVALLYRSHLQDHATLSIMAQRPGNLKEMIYTRSLSQKVSKREKPEFNREALKRVYTVCFLDI